MASHYEIGNSQDIHLTYETSNKFSDFSNCPPVKAALNKDQMADLRAVHYQLGNYPCSYSTTAKESFIAPKGAERARLSEEVRKDLRAHHFEVNSGNTKVHRSQYAGI